MSSAVLGAPPLGTDPLERRPAQGKGGLDCTCCSWVRHQDRTWTTLGTACSPALPGEWGEGALCSAQNILLGAACPPRKVCTTREQMGEALGPAWLALLV